MIPDYRRRQRAGTGMGDTYAPFYAQGTPGSMETPVRLNWWVEPPPGFRSFDEQASIAVPAAATETTILTFTSPRGFGGVIKALVCAFVGTGWVFGDGALTWRVKRNGVAYDGYNQIVSQIGEPQFAETVIGGLLFAPGDIITVTIVNTNPALGAGRTVARVVGYRVPESIIGVDYRG